MYDFMVFGFFASYIAAAFFPAADELTSIIAALMAFGAGFLTRPLGGLLLGAYADRFGRQSCLVLSTALMGVGTLAIAVTPSYQQIGATAPALILIGRLVQGLAAGVQVGGASVYLLEIAPTGKRGFYVAWQSASQQAAVVLAALIGFVTTSHLSDAQMASFGFRLPFLLGCTLIPFSFVLRRWLDETPAFLARRVTPTIGAVLSSIARNWRLVCFGAMLVVMTTVFFYMITSYTPTYGSAVLNLSPHSSMLVTLCVGAVNFVLLPTMGGLSDRVGRKALMIPCLLLALISSYPALYWLASAPSFGRLLTVELWLAAIYATYNGAMIVFLTELMPENARATGFSVAYSVAVALFGGFTPALSTTLIRHAQRLGYSHSEATPGLWLAAAALISLSAFALFRGIAAAQVQPETVAGSSVARTRAAAPTQGSSATTKEA